MGKNNKKELNVTYIIKYLAVCIMWIGCVSCTMTSIILTQRIVPLWFLFIPAITHMHLMPYIHDTNLDNELSELDDRLLEAKKEYLSTLSNKDEKVDEETNEDN